MLKPVIRALGWLAGVGFGTMGIASLAFSGLLSTHLVRDREDWYFPGDPAWAEVTVEVWLVSVLPCLAFLAVARLMGWTRHRSIRWAVGIAVVLAVATLTVPVTCIAQRRLGEWARLRTFVWQQVDEARAKGTSAREFKPPLEFQFAGQPEPLKIRAVSAGRWPSVLLDFGHGGNASLDLRTMWCDYSD
jgi:hypothetical protein